MRNLQAEYQSMDSWFKNYAESKQQDSSKRRHTELKEHLLAPDARLVKLKEKVDNTVSKLAKEQEKQNELLKDLIGKLSNKRMTL
jgi:hypothetical protein